MTRNHLASGGAPEPHVGPSTPDAGVQEIVQLLGLVAEEEQVLARLDRSVADLNRIAVARGALAGCTRIELAEARAWATRPVTTESAPMLPVADGADPS